MIARGYPGLAGRGGLDSGVHRTLDVAGAGPAPNGVAPTGILEFLGKIADGTNWDERAARITAPTLQAGTAPTYDQPSAFLGSTDGAVLGNGGGYYLAGNNDDGNVGTADLWLRVAARVVASKVLYAKRTTGVGYVVGFDATPALYVTIQDADGAVTVTSAALVAGTFVWADCAINRDDATMGGRWFISDAASGTLVDCSAVEKTLDAAVALALLADSAGANQFTSMLEFVGIYWRADWFRAGATGAADVLSEHKIQRARVYGSRPLISIASATSLAAGGNAGPAYQGRVTAGVTRLHYMGAGAPRFEQRVDANGRTFTGMLIEAGAINQCYPPTGVQGVPIAATTATTSTATAYESATVWRNLVEDATTAVHWTFGGVGELAPAGAASISILIRQPPTGGRQYACVGYLDNDTANLTYIIVDLQTGGLSGWKHTILAYVTPIFASAMQVATGEWLVRLAAACNSRNERMGVGLSSNGLTINNYAGDPVTYPNGVWFALAQTELGAYPSSYIKTVGVGAPVTRAADTPHRLSGAAHFGGQGFALHHEVLCAAFTPTRNHHLWTAYKSGSAATEYVKCYIDTSGKLNVTSATAGGDSGAVITAAAINDNAIRRYCVSLAHNKLRLWTRGTTGGWVEAARDTAVDLVAGLDTLDWGADEGAANQAGPGVWPGSRYQLIDHPVEDPLPEPGGFVVS